MNQEKIGRFIAECRKNKKLTQEQLAEKLGVTNKSISRWENGKTMPDYSILKELCNTLEFDMNEFLAGERIKKEEVQSYSVENLDSILKEYYKMKKQKNVFKVISIIIGVIAINLFIIFCFLFNIMFMLGIFNKYEVTTDTNKYQQVIGVNAEKNYKDKWGISEKIFPKTIDKLNVLDFKMVYYDPFDKQYLSYLIVDYNDDEYAKEVARLNNYGVEDYIGYYGVTGFTKYKLLAMESDSYYGFVYAITDEKSKIIYVELIFCNYVMDIKYDEQIAEDYLPDNFNAKDQNDYRRKMLNE